MVRSMKSQNMAFDLHVGCVTSRGVEKVQTVFTIVKAHFRGCGEKEIVL